MLLLRMKDISLLISMYDNKSTDVKSVNLPD
jgi:hypothetical protein